MVPWCREAGLEQDKGLSTDNFFTVPSFGCTTGLASGEDEGEQGSGCRYSRLFVSSQNLAGTLIPRGVTFARGSTMNSGVPELLPEDTLSVSDEAERSPWSNEALLVVSSNIIDCSSNLTVAKMGSFFSEEQFKLLVNGLDGGALEAGHRWWLSEGLEFSK